MARKMASLSEQHTIETPPQLESRMTPRARLGWIVLGLMVLFASCQVAADLLYGFSLGIYCGPEGFKLQAHSHAQFHNLVLLSMLVVTFAMVWILDYTTGPVWRRTPTCRMAMSEGLQTRNGGTGTHPARSVCSAVRPG